MFSPINEVARLRMRQFLFGVPEDDFGAYRKRASKGPRTASRGAKPYGMVIV
jgi:hypothetical protein